MGLLDRLSQLIRANVNDLIDRAEDPEKVLNQLLRDMQANITQARAQVLAMIAQEKELEGDIEQTQRLAQEWGRKAQAAINVGKDDLAREALRRRRDNEASAQLYVQQHETQAQTVAQLKVQLRLLESKYQSTLRQRDALVARQRRAKSHAKVAASLTNLSPLDPSAELERMEGKIRGREAQTAALTELASTSFDAQFRELEDPAIEADLQALKSGVLTFTSASSGAARMSSSDRFMLDDLEIERELEALRRGEEAPQPPSSTSADRSD